MACQWRLVIIKFVKESNIYKTKCGKIHEANKCKGFNNCPYCGQELQIVDYQELKNENKSINT